MIKIHIVCVGKFKEQYWKDAEGEYLKRLSRFCKTDVKELSESTLKEEADNILHSVKGRVFALAIEGERLSSEKFAAKIKISVDKGEEITFVIGSSEGLDGRVKERADEKISFSDMTFPHQMARVILEEQIYRSFMILSGSTYHK